MRYLARLSLAMGGLSLALPALAQAQSAPPLAPPLMAPTEIPASAPAPRQANPEFSIPTGVTATDKDARAVEAQLRKAGPPRIVSESYVVEGQPVVMTPSSAPGRAVVTDAPARFQPSAVAPGEPEPIGVMRTNYAAARPTGPGVGPQMPPQGSTPYNPMMGRHGVGGEPMGGGSAPFLPSSGEAKPRIFAHLFGLDGISNAFRDAREARIEARKRREILRSYSGNGVDEVPASAIYGRNAH